MLRLICHPISFKIHMHYFYQSLTQNEYWFYSMKVNQMATKMAAGCLLYPLFFVRKRGILILYQSLPLYLSVCVDVRT